AKMFGRFKLNYLGEKGKILKLQNEKEIARMGLKGHNKCPLSLGISFGIPPKPQARSKQSYPGLGITRIVVVKSDRSLIKAFGERARCGQLG
ncbi:hypothetical protein J6590_037810, partial [Homalodisca vitripennis]